MRESTESKPNTNGTSRDAISPDVKESPQNDDWRRGVEDGTEFNPYPHPYDRTGPALEAYSAGYKHGLEVMEGWFDDFNGDPPQFDTFNYFSEH